MDVAQVGDVHVSMCALDDEQELSAAFEVLDADEQARAARFNFELDRRRFVQAHAFLRRELAARLGGLPANLPLVTSRGRKPYIEGRSLSFSLSHAGPLAVLAISDRQEVGIDLEFADHSDSFAADLPSVAENVLTPDERRALMAVDKALRPSRFAAYWTAKEARMKLTGEGFDLAPRAIALELRDGRPIGYLRPLQPRARLAYVPLPAADAVCALAFGAPRD